MYKKTLEDLEKKLKGIKLDEETYQYGVGVYGDSGAQSTGVKKKKTKPTGTSPSAGITSGGGDAGGDGGVGESADEVKAEKPAKKVKPKAEKKGEHFDAKDINKLVSLDFDNAMTAAQELIQKSTTKDEKKNYLLRQLSKQRNNVGIMSLLYNMLLAGEGLGVADSGYKKKFGEAGNGKKKEVSEDEYFTEDEIQVDEAGELFLTPQMKNKIKRFFDPKGHSAKFKPALDMYNKIAGKTAKDPATVVAQLFGLDTKVFMDYIKTAQNEKGVKKEGRLEEERPTIMTQLAREMSKMPSVEKLVGFHAMTDGFTAFLRTKDGNAYEVQLRAAPNAHHFQKERGVGEGKKGKPQQSNNPVAKNAGKFNKAAVHKDKKKDYSRKGKDKFDKRKAVDETSLDKVHGGKRIRTVKKPPQNDE